jgi:hypothetical protein
MGMAIETPPEGGAEKMIWFVFLEVGTDFSEISK